MICFCSPEGRTAVGASAGVVEGVTSSAPALNTPLSRAREGQDASRSVLPALVTIAEAEHPRSREGIKRNLAVLGGPQGASICRPSSSTGRRTTSDTAGGGLGSSGGLRPRWSRICLMATWSWR